MIKRYEDKTLAYFWGDECKVSGWQEVELAVIFARVQLNIITTEVFKNISSILYGVPINIERWLELEKELKHDLNAFVKERKEHLPTELRRYFHDGLTSYDTEEPAFVLTLTSSCNYIIKRENISALEDELISLAKKYCFTPMNARTHGQEAEMQSFGARCLTWLAELRLGKEQLIQAMEKLQYSKLSGAIGKYGSIDPELEEKALAVLKLKPFFGATQIAPRGLYLPTAQALCQICQVVDKIALDIRLMARSGNPLVQEPFGKKQTGSSAMPHKKNTISTEKNAGMARLASGYLQAIERNMSTWEERAIEQSSCERVAWPDLFQVTAHSLQTLTKVLRGLKVYPDNMLQEIVNSRGCYAAAQAKDFLREYGSVVGIDEEDAYRIVQLAAFNVHSPDVWAHDLRDNPVNSLEQADNHFIACVSEGNTTSHKFSIEEVISCGCLKYSEQLEADEKKIMSWNEKLHKFFSDQQKLDEWRKLFLPSYLLRNEPYLFRKIIGWTHRIVIE